MRRLEHIAQHGSIASRVKKFYFQADRLRQDMDYEKWDTARQVPLSREEYDLRSSLHLAFIPEDCGNGQDNRERGNRATERALLRSLSKLRGNCS